MILKFLKLKWLKILGAVVLTFTLLISLILFLLGHYGSPILQNKVNKALLKSTDSLYHVTFTNAELHILHGEVVINNLTVTPDTAVFNRLRKLHTSPDKLYKLSVQKMILNHIHPFKLYFKHQLDISQILLSGPEIHIASYTNLDKRKKPKDNRTIYQKISNSLKMLHVGQIIFQNVKLKHEDFSAAKPSVTAFNELDLRAQDLLIDSATQLDTSRFLYCRELTVELHNYHGRTANALYGYQAKSIKFSTRTRQLHVQGITLRALQNPAGFFSKTYQDRFYIHVSTLQLNNFDFEIYDKSHTIKATNLLLANGTINVFSNPRINPKSFSMDKVITFPNKAIQMLPIKFEIDTIKVQNYAIGYREYNIKAKRSGYITFDKVNGHFYNVTNDSAALAKKHLCFVKLNARFMNKANTDIAFTFNLTDSLCSYSYRGSVGPVNMQAVNVATVPLASINIKSGLAKKLDFAMQANRYSAKGKVTFLYNNLKIQLLKADSAELKMRHLALASLLANSLIIKDNNPDKAGEQPRSAQVIYQRPKNYPFFETLWRTLLMGIKPNVGLDFKTQQDADLKLAQKEKEKYFKEHKKEARKKQRQEKRQLKKFKKAQDKARKQAEKEY